MCATLSARPTREASTTRWDSPAISVVSKGRVTQRRRVFSFALRCHCACGAVGWMFKVNADNLFVSELGLSAVTAARYTVTLFKQKDKSSGTKVAQVDVS